MIVPLHSTRIANFISTLKMAFELPSLDSGRAGRLMFIYDEVSAVKPSRLKIHGKVLIIASCRSSEIVGTMAVNCMGYIASRLLQKD